MHAQPRPLEDADFSQVEADAQQVNLTRFNLFFPEKREFFLENQGAFQVGPPASGASNLVPFFSRTIGLSDAGEPIPIVGGGRLTGKVGRNTLALLNIQTEDEERPGASSLPASNFSVLRYGREFLTNSLNRRARPITRNQLWASIRAFG